MGRGEQTRDAILETALQVASRVGLGGLTIGTLSEELDLSKSGLFAHFGSKESLMLRTLEYAEGRFIEAVVDPALAAPRGEPRLRVLFERTLRWPQLVPQPGGCIFMAASAEFDDRPGPVRDLVRASRRRWRDLVAGAVRRAIDAGHFRRDVDPEQLGFELDGILLAWQHASRLLGDPRADARAHEAFEALVARARVRSRS
jgi:AcrR family transcriptional regulator